MFSFIVSSFFSSFLEVSVQLQIELRIMEVLPIMKLLWDHKARVVRQGQHIHCQGQPQIFPIILNNYSDDNEH